MITISIHQPNYIPWIGYFYKIARSDIFVFLDDAQFSNRGMHNYHYIKTPQGSFRLKIPVTGSLGDQINTVKTRDELNWKTSHLKILTSNYKRSKYFDEVYNDFSQLINPQYPNLAIQNETIIRFICNKLGIQTRFETSSDMDIKSTREERIIDICQSLEGDVYYSGSGAKEYQNEDNFIRNGIRIRYSDFKPFKYPQNWGEFQSNVTIIDYLMNCGYDWERIEAGQNE